MLRHWRTTGEEEASSTLFSALFFVCRDIRQLEGGEPPKHSIVMRSARTGESRRF
jgi:hypothetical protein